MQNDRFPATPAGLKPPQSPRSNDSAANSASAGFQTVKSRSAGRFKLPPGRGVPTSLRKVPATPPVAQTSHHTRPRFATPQTSQVISRSRSNSVTSTSSSIGAGWSKEIDPASGKAYYFHADKGITQWDAPPGFEEKVPPAESLQKANEVEIPPSIATEPRDHAEDREVPLSLESDSNKVDGIQEWQQLIDHSSGKTFYYNSVTGESRWDKPALLDTVAPEKENHEMNESTPGVLAQNTAELEGIERSNTPEEETDIPEEQHSTPEEQTDIPMEQMNSPEEQHNTPEEAHPKAVNLDKLQSFEKTNATNVEDSYNTLPPGWQSVTDPSVGTYFFNEVTGETSWEFPTAASSPRELEADELSKDETLPENWKQIVDPSSGSRYFYNKETGETSWDPPRQENGDVALSEAQFSEKGIENLEQEGTSDVLPPEKETPPLQVNDSSLEDDDGVINENADNLDEVPTLLPGWIKLEDEETSKVYYYNKVTGETAWEIPSEITPVDEESKQIDQLDVEDEITQCLLDGWSKQVDPSSGQVYYFNENTGESSWDIPIRDVATVPLEVETSDPEKSEVEPSAFGERIANFPSDQQNSVEPSGSALDGQSSPSAPSDNDPLIEVDSSTTVQSLDEKAADDGPVLKTDAETEAAQEPPYPFSDWKKEIDEATGNYYYVNQETGETTWDSPRTINKIMVDADNDMPFESSAKESQGESCSSQMDSSAPEELPRQDPDPESIPSVAPLPEGWQQMVDPVSGDVYYYNEETEETSWDPPVTISKDGNTTVGKNSIPGVPMVLSEASHQSEPPQVDTLDNELNVDPLPRGWTRISDPSSGELYFYNKETGETSWEPPNEKVQDAVPELSIVEPIHGNTVRALLEDVEPSLIVSSSNQEIIWQKRVDESSGETFYFNELTGESSWDPPSIACGEDQRRDEPETVSHDNIGATTVHNEVMVSDLEVVNDEQTHESQHVASIKTKSISHVEQKDKQTIEEKDDLSDELLTSWRKVEDSSIANEAHYGDETTDISCDPPAVAIPRGLATSVPEEKWNLMAQSDVKPEISPGLQLPLGWEQVTDESSGDVYYYNQQSGETSWEPPGIAISSSENDSDARGDQGQQSCDQASQLKPVCNPLTGNDSLLPGWEKLVDPSSGRPYYYNRIQNTTSWEPPSDAIDDWIEVSHPSGQPTSSKLSSETTNTSPINHTVGRLGSFATFGFGGRLCVSNGLSSKITVHRSRVLLPSHSVVKVESVKHEAGFSGPLNAAATQSVLSYLERKTKRQTDLIWSLCLIASNAKGRLRSDDRVKSSNEPESAIVDLLLCNTDKHDFPGSYLVQEQQMSNNDSGLDEIQLLLLRGDRDEAVERSLLHGHYALALLVASMCTREVYVRAAKSFTESVLCKGSPLHTVAELYCSQLQSTQTCGVDPMMWSHESGNLKQAWRKHLAAIISNRAAGWDILAAALGDRLKELGEVVPAHVCYMVCGCSLSPPARKDSKFTLLGCDVCPANLLLLTDDSVESFCRAEAYEWAKRRGNKKAAIQSIQGFKLQYALLLSDLGFVEEAKKYITSIKDCLGFREDDDMTLEKSYPKVVSLLTADRLGILRQVLELESRLVGSAEGGLQSTDNPDIDSSFVTADTSGVSKSRPLEAPAEVTDREVSTHVQSEPKRPPPSSSSSVPKKSHPKEMIGVTAGSVTNPNESISKKNAPLPSGASVATRGMASEPAIVSGSEAFGHSRPSTTTTPDRKSGTSSHPLTQPNLNKKRNPQPEQAPRSAPPNLQSPSFGFMNKLKDRIIKWQNPDAHIANPGEEMQAYYDKERKVWVFPGEDPDVLAKPIGPPPSASTPSMTPAPIQPKNNDPLAAMMAPPQRAPSSLRGRPPLTASPGTLPPYTPIAAGVAPMQSPPQFMVFKPVTKPVAEEQKEEKS